MSFMPNTRSTTTTQAVLAQPATVLRVHDVQAGTVTVGGELVHPTANTGRSTILRVHDLNTGSVQIIEFTGYY
jgi:hypothetical protein